MDISVGTKTDADLDLVKGASKLRSKDDPILTPGLLTGLLKVRFCSRPSPPLIRRRIHLRVFHLPSFPPPPHTILFPPPLPLLSDPLLTSLSIGHEQILAGLDSEVDLYGIMEGVSSPFGSCPEVAHLRADWYAFILTTFGRS